ncbi:hypothetical protein ABT061_28165 [Streptosporangium sp. NPDC002544]
MSRINIDDIPFEGAELDEVAGGRMTVSWRNSKGQVGEWWVS